jgi:perosamine synthetase
VKGKSSYKPIIKRRAEIKEYNVRITANGSNAAITEIRIPVCAPKIGEDETRYVVECIQSTWVSGISKYVKEFEEKFARYCGCKYGIATNSGTTALHLALATLGIEKGDEIIMPTFTMIATANAIAYTGAKPILIDAEFETWNMDTSKVKEKITEHTKAIMPVHTYGHPVDMDPISETAENFGLYIIEDAAEAHGAEYKGRRIGNIGDMGCFSFYANKIITTGEGGMIVTNNEELAEKARWLRDHAFGKHGKHFYHEALGFGYRMSALQAAFGLAQLNHINEFVSIRRSNAKLYNSLLSELGGKITLPPEAPWAKNVYWMYSILIQNKFGISRDELMKRLEFEGIETRTFFYPIHVQPIYTKQYPRKSFPVANELSKKGINLPSGNNLTADEVAYVCECIKKYAKKGS